MSSSAFQVHTFWSLTLLALCQWAPGPRRAFLASGAGMEGGAGQATAVCAVEENAQCQGANDIRGCAVAEAAQRAAEER